MQAPLVGRLHDWLPPVGILERVGVLLGSIPGLVAGLLALPVVCLLDLPVVSLLALPVVCLLTLPVVGPTLLPAMSAPALPPVSHIGSSHAIENLVTERAMAAFGSLASSLLDAYVELPFGLLLVGAGYSRYDDSDPLDHEVRSAITETVETTPGIYLSDLTERTNVPLSTLRHHLQVLETERVLTSTKIRGKRRYFPIHSTGHALIAALSEAATAAILETLWRNGPSSVSSVAAAIDRDPSTVSYHLRRLEVDAVVERERDGRVVMTKLSQRTRTVFERADLAGQNGETATAIGGESGHV